MDFLTIVRIDIDTTNPEARIGIGYDSRQHFEQGFDSIWADETEPDLPPNSSYFHIGQARAITTSTALSTGALYDGFRRDTPHRFTLTRDAYTVCKARGQSYGPPISLDWTR